MSDKKLKNLFERFKNFEETPFGKKIIKLVSILFTLGVIAYLIYKLSMIGWNKVWSSLPQTPWFYILLLAMFFTLPVFQLLAYRVSWKTARWDLFLAMMNKRVLDKDVMGYSGEMYLYIWARKNIPQPEKQILHVIKDNIILSSASSTMVAVILLITFFALGSISLPESWIHPEMYQIAVFIFCLVMIIGLTIKFRKSILSLERRQLWIIFFLHVLRLLVVEGFQVLQWMVVMPDIPIVNWLTLLAIQIIITRIPLLPSRDLIFMGTGIEMSNFMNVSTPAMAGMLLASSVLNKVLNLFFFLLVFFTTRKRLKAKQASNDRVKV